MKQVYINKILSHEWMFIPISSIHGISNTIILQRTEQGLSFGDRVIIRCSPQDNITVGNLLIDKNGTIGILSTDN
jgi:hypothetical protein